MILQRKIISIAIEVTTAWEERNGILYTVISGGNLRDTWIGAKERCKNEEAILFSPSNRTREWTVAFLMSKH